MKSGIYTITNLVNNKIYVGYAKNMTRRKDWHYCSLRSDSHANIHLQSAYNKYGEENFVFEILEECEIYLMPSLEHYWCNMLNVHNREIGYNIKPTHPDNKPKNISEETRQKQRLSQLGKIRDRSAVEKTRIKLLGKSRPKEVMEKIVATRIKNNNYKKILQYDLNGNFIKEWRSAGEIKKTLGYLDCSIYRVCYNKLKTYKKYKWKFKIENDK